LGLKGFVVVDVVGVIEVFCLRRLEVSNAIKFSLLLCP